MALRIGFGIGLLLLAVVLAALGFAVQSLRPYGKDPHPWPREPIRTWEDFVSVNVRRFGQALFILAFFVLVFGVACLYSLFSGD